MEITVKMDTKEFEKYMEYLKEKESIRGDYNQLRNKHEKLCNLICDSVPKEGLSVINEEKLFEAFNLAYDWFC